MDERKDHLWKVAQEVEDRIDDLEKTGAHPMGCDVGTSKVVAARQKARNIETGAQLNAFIPVPYSRFTENILGQNQIAYYRDNGELVIYGTATEKFANMFNANVRRPMADGLVNAKEKLALPVLEAILQTLIPKARTAGRDPRLLRARRHRRQGGGADLPRGHAAPLLRGRSATRRWPSTRAWPSSSPSWRTRTSPASASPAAAACAT